MDEARVEALVTEIADIVRRHLAAGPAHPDRVFELLNALAVNSALVLAGTGPDAAAKVFFADTLSGQLQAARREQADAIQ
jgi:hypothetical protein